MEANEVKTLEGKKVMVFQHKEQPKGKYRQQFLYLLTGNAAASASPTIPMYGIHWNGRRNALY
jgi:hypothetical protein